MSSPTIRAAAGGRRLRAFLPFAGALAVTACGGGGSSLGPSGVLLAGRYASSLSASFSNAYEQHQIALTGTITLNAQDAAGNFSGSFALQDGSSGNIAGNVRPDGGFAVTQFGDPSATPLASLLDLQNTFPYCNWAAAASTGALSGSVVGNSITITGAINALCTYNTQAGVVNAPTSVTFTINGTHP
jgi:hypothetical protein